MDYWKIMKVWKSWDESIWLKPTYSCEWINKKKYEDFKQSLKIERQDMFIWFNKNPKFKSLMSQEDYAKKKDEDYIRMRQIIEDKINDDHSPTFARLVTKVELYFNISHEEAREMVIDREILLYEVFAKKYKKKYWTLYTLNDII